MKIGFGYADTWNRMEIWTQEYLVYYGELLIFNRFRDSTSDLTSVHNDSINPTNLDKLPIREWLAVIWNVICGYNTCMSSSRSFLTMYRAVDIA